MRSRNIKPGFFLNEDLSNVDYATRLLFIGLWCFADREGRFEWKPKKIHAAIFPYDHDLNIEKMLCNLMSLHLITCNDKVGYIPCFLKHQHPHPHEAKSALPCYDNVVNENNEQIQCHDMSLQSIPMSLQIMKCQADIRNPDIRNPDSNNNNTNVLSSSEKPDDKIPPPENEKTPYKEIVSIFHEVLPEFPPIIKLTDARKTALRGRWNTEEKTKSLEWWKEYFEWIRESDFLMGRTKNSFACGFDWIIKAANFIKIREGNYHK